MLSPSPVELPGVHRSGKVRADCSNRKNWGFACRWEEADGVPEPGGIRVQACESDTEGSLVGG